MNTPETDEIVKAYHDQRESVGGIIDHAESLERERDDSRREAEEFRDGMRIHLTEGPGTFSWENAELSQPTEED